MAELAGAVLFSCLRLLGVSISAFHAIVGNSLNNAAEDGMTIAELWAEIEDSRPGFVDVQLAQNNQVISDENNIHLELQAVVTRSPKKAL